MPKGGTYNLIRDEVLKGMYKEAKKHRFANNRDKEVFFTRYICNSTQKLGFGRCGEQARVAMNYLREKGVQNCLLVWLEHGFGNHEFIVLGADRFLERIRSSKGCTFDL